MHYVIRCAHCGETFSEYHELLDDHATCAPPSEEAIQAQAQAMARGFHQFQTRLKLAAAGVILTHGGAPKRRRHRGGRGRKKVAR